MFIESRFIKKVDFAETPNCDHDERGVLRASFLI